MKALDEMLKAFVDAAFDAKESGIPDEDILRGIIDTMFHIAKNSNSLPLLKPLSEERSAIFLRKNVQ